jgi:hypothetical protein
MSILSDRLCEELRSENWLEVRRILEQLFADPEPPKADPDRVPAPSDAEEILTWIETQQPDIVEVGDPVPGRRWACREELGRPWFYGDTYREAVRLAMRMGRKGVMRK